MILSHCNRTVRSISSKPVVSSWIELKDYSHKISSIDRLRSRNTRNLMVMAVYKGIRRRTRSMTRIIKWVEFQDQALISQIDLILVSIIKWINPILNISSSLLVVKGSKEKEVLILQVLGWDQANIMWILINRVVRVLILRK